MLLLYMLGRTSQDIRECDDNGGGSKSKCVIGQEVRFGEIVVASCSNCNCKVGEEVGVVVLVVTKILTITLRRYMS